MHFYRFIVYLTTALLLLSCRETINEQGPVDEAYPHPLYTQAPTIDSDILKARRDALLESLPAGTMVFLTTQAILIRNGDVAYAFHPSPAFFYLTGFGEPNAVAVIRPAPSALGSSELILFVEERSAVEVQWMGPVHGVQGAVEIFGADSAYDVDLWPQIVGSYLAAGTVQSVCSNLTENTTVQATYTGIVPTTITTMNIGPFVDELRLVKSDIEIECIRRAARISAQAFGEAIRRIRPALFEYEVEAIFDLVFRINDCSGTAFPSIIASGPNIVTLHYDANTRHMADNDLVMIDIGAEYGFYASDVTRTLPVNGSFTHEQAVIYDIVHQAYDAVLSSAIPGMSYYTLYAMQRDLIIDRMLSLGIISGTRDEIVSSGRYRQYIPAGLAHSVGLDVHDPWPRDAQNDKILRENMILAVEPHIYLNPNDLSVAEPYRGVCARIEDDILITRTGPEVLSGELPTRREELELLMDGG